jgi:hypothetical protein
MKADFFESPDETLETIEAGIGEFESIIRGSMVAVAIGLGRIKRDSLFLPVADSFNDYVRLGRSGLKKIALLNLAISGEKILKYQASLESHNIRLSKVLYKIRYLNDTVVFNDPQIWDLLQVLSEGEFKNYVETQTAQKMSPGPEIGNFNRSTGNSRYF